MRPRTLLPLLLAAAAGGGVTVALVAGGPAEHPRVGIEQTSAVVPSSLAPAGSREPRPSGVGCSPGQIVRLGDERVAYAVTVVRRATAFRRPGAGRIAAFGRLNVNGVPTVFGVLGARVDSSCRPTWYRVQLPLHPNGITGWVRAGAVRETTVSTRIVVDLSARRVTLYRGGRPVLIAAAAVGSPSTPTPTGRFYVNQKLVAPDPWGPYGPAALGISAFSPVLRSWAQGGPIAIHGTNAAELLGSAVSHGCVRVSNDEVLRLFRLVPTGTPVLIRM